MSLKISVKVGEVNNLTVARYCAGMGVEMLGFSFDQNSPKFVDPAKFTEISNWISGVKLVGEFHSESADYINTVSKELVLDFVQVEEQDFTPLNVSHILIPKILKINLENRSLEELKILLTSYENLVTFFLIESDTEQDILKDKNYWLELAQRFQIILGTGITQNNILVTIDIIKPAGISIKGGTEIRPGLKNFDEIASILEKLEVEL